MFPGHEPCPSAIECKWDDTDIGKPKHWGGGGGGWLALPLPLCPSKSKSESTLCTKISFIPDGEHSAFH